MYLNSVCAYFIPSAQFAILIHSFITSRIDFCNSVYFTLPDYSRSQIQTVQTSCAKCLTGARRFDSAKEALKTLHWLPVKARAHFKILFAYKIFHHVPNTPMYFQDQFYIQDRVCVTRSSCKNLLSCHHSSRLSTVGDRLFYVAVVTFWNSLPTDLQSSSSLSGFKSALKTHIFRLYFKC